MYVDKAGMIDRYGELTLVQLTDRGAPHTGAIDDTVLCKALADAAAVVHGYARAAGYAVPLAPVPDMVAGWQASIALYLLYQGATPDKVKKDYEITLGQLKELAAGRIVLQAAGVESPAPADGASVLFAGSDRIMTAAGLKGF